MTQQTAIDWLFTQILGSLHSTMNKADIDKVLEQAKQMEKDQMKRMYIEGGFAQMRYFDGKEFLNAEQYYNETYNK